MPARPWFLKLDPVRMDGALYSDSQDKANILNHYFSTVITNSNNSSDLPNMGPSPYPDITEIEITTAGVKNFFKILSHLNLMDLIKSLANS